MANAQAPKMNVLLITADQWRGDCLSLVGHPCVKTPNIDALGRDGVCFTRHYSQAAPCGPARASLHTGLYLMNHRVCINGTPLDARHANVALEARRAGYEPTLFGYTDSSVDPRTVDPGDARLLTYEGVLPGFHQRLVMDTPPALEWKNWLRRQGIDVPGKISDLYHTEKAEAGRLNVADHLTQQNFRAEHTETRFVTEEVLSFLDERAGSGWFAHVSYIRPHPPLSVPEPYASMVAPGDTPPPARHASLAEEQAQHPILALMHERAKKDWFVTGQGDQSSAEWTAKEVAEIRAIYYAMLAEVDAEIGRVIDHLKQIGDYENTLIVMTSDHGELLGDHYLFGKHNYFDEAYHIPLIIRAPDSDMSRGTQVSRFTEAVDLMPTILEMIGQEIPSQVDGQSLTPFLRGETPERWRQEAHWEFDFRDVIAGAPERRLDLTLDQCSLAAIRGERYKYVHFPGLPALFLDLERDPDGLENRAEDPDYRDLVLEYAQKMLSWRMAHADRTLSGMVVGPQGLVTRSHTERRLPRR
jgi:arylsulfatase A-like enzyme